MFSFIKIMPNKGVIDRETKPLLQIADNHPKLILSMDEGTQTGSIQGIKHDSITNWLLS